MKQLSNLNKTVTLKTSSFDYTASVSFTKNEIYLKSSAGEKLTWELNSSNLSEVNSALLELNLKDGVSIDSYDTSKEFNDFNEEELYSLYDTLEDDYSMDEILKAL